MAYSCYATNAVFPSNIRHAYRIPAWLSGSRPTPGGGRVKQNQHCALQTWGTARMHCRLLITISVLLYWVLPSLTESYLRFTLLSLTESYRVLLTESYFVKLYRVLLYWVLPSLRLDLGRNSQLDWRTRDINFSWTHWCLEGKICSHPRC